MCTAMSGAAFTVFEDWQAAAPGDFVNGYNSWTGINRSDDGFWTGNYLLVETAEDGNQFVRHHAPRWQSRGFSKAMGTSAITDGQVATVYLTFKAESAAPLRHYYALTDLAAPDNINQDVVCISMRGQDTGSYRLDALSGNSYVTLRTDLVPNVWYHVWLLIDHSADTYDVYLTDGSEPQSQDRIGTGLGFRYGTGEPLDTFYAWAGKMSSSDSATVCLDRIAVDLSGESLHTLLPLSADLTDDYFIDLEDLTVLSRLWLRVCEPGQGYTNGDFDNSGRIDLGDLAVLGHDWLRSSIRGLVGWWPLNEGGGPKVYDLLRQVEGDLINTEPKNWVPSGDGYVLRLDAEHDSDGRGEYLRLPHLIQHDFTIAFWVRTTKIAAAGDHWTSGMGMVDAEAAGVQDDFSITLLRDKVAFGVGGADTGDVTIRSTTAINDGYWHYIAATRDGTTGKIKLYVDGVLEASGTGSTGLKDAQSRILIGSMNEEPGKYLRGAFAQLRFYDKVLFDDEITALANTKVPAVTPKKGAGNTSRTKLEMLNIEWAYNWNIARPAELDGAIDYVPMRHNKWWPSLENLAAVGDVDYLLGHNEPDKENQADMTVSEVVDQWPQLQAKADEYDLLLGSPATAHYNSQWIEEFMAVADAPGSGMRVDYMCVHSYIGPNPDRFMDNLAWVHHRWGRDVWVTEFNVADWDGNNSYTQAQSYTFMAEVLHRMEAANWLKRYAIFPWDGSSEQSKASPIFEQGTDILTPLGRLYASWDGDIDGPNENTWYFIHHEGSHRRIRATGSDVEMMTISSMGDRVQWRLIGGDNGWYFIENNNSKQRLGYDNVSKRLTLKDAAVADEAVQWKMVVSEHGWYHIDHRLTGKRLYYSTDLGIITLESSDSSGVNGKWRFIKP